MKHIFTAIAAVCLLGASMLPAAASTLFADSVINVDCTTNCPGSGRDDPLAALNSPDGNFFSLGLGGSAEFGFGQSFTGPGMVVEVTNGNVAGYGIESIDVLVGNLGTGVWTKVAEVFNTSAQSGFSFSFAGVFDAVRLVDTTASNCGNAASCSGDGFDVDSIGVSPVPVPAAGLLLLTALGGMAVFRRQKQASMAA